MAMARYVPFQEGLMTTAGAPAGAPPPGGSRNLCWPHANLLLSFLLARTLVATRGRVYRNCKMIMPRSGRDYVRVSRALRPFFGFFSNFSLTFVFLTWIALTALFAAPLEAGEWKN
jgi:amino acid transporter